MKQCASCGAEKPLSEFYARASKCKSCISEINKKKYREDTDKYRDKELRKNYGITLDDWNEMFVKQGGACGICGTHQCSTKKAFAVDHDHKTGKVRALLCQNCNTALGKFNDDKSIIQRAARYLESFEE